ncbi:hypothetical protein TNCV_1178791 [Trichonephila clavipes]|nr:hypothetical protein TNCV_1178791 [Trichonephila clavipes]
MQAGEEVEAGQQRSRSPRPATGQQGSRSPSPTTGQQRSRFSFQQFQKSLSESRTIKQTTQQAASDQKI